MWKILKFILIASLFLAAIALIFWIGKIEPGTVLAGITAIIAAIKAKLFGEHDLEEDLQRIEKYHQVQKTIWKDQQRIFDSTGIKISEKLLKLEEERELLIKELDSMAESSSKSPYTEMEISERLKKIPE